MRRREFLRGFSTLVAASALPLSSPAPEKPRIALTMDDPSTTLGRNIAWREANSDILETLRKWNLSMALFVCGMRIDSQQGKELLHQWDEAGHLICNHSYSHFNFNSEKKNYEDFAADFERNEPLLRQSRHFTRLFRYPFLKEGDTADKRDRFRALLKQKGYAVGHVTIDTSDWYVDDRMNARLDQQPAASTEPYGEYLVSHLLDRAAFYRQLAMDVLGREIPHIYLDDVISAFSDRGWQWIDARRAFDDPVFKRQPQTLPAGESLVWALAKESGHFEDRLRYPGEDESYEKHKMDDLGL